MPKILVVDDDVDIIDIVKIVLQSKKYIVHSMLKWEDLAVIIPDFKPDLIILDITLRGADGRDICRKLKKDELTMNTPVLLFSALLGIEKTYAECNADGFIAKPFDVNSFIDKIGTILN